MKKYLEITSHTRYPVVAGYFYPSDPRELIKIIEWSFKHSLGPGKLPVVSENRRKETLGYIAPHAGYIYSGPVAAHTYYNLALDGRPETIILLGTNHTGRGALVSIYPAGTWITPLGKLEVDSELARDIANNSSIGELDIYAHIEEHSIEVQLPFIQYLYGDSVRIVPISIGLHTPEVAEDLAKAILESITSTKRDVIIIVSSDFNHYDPHEITVEKDKKALEKILSFNTNGFYRVLLDEHITVCGPGGIMTLMEYSKLVGKGREKAELLKYATSGDVSGDKTAVVGYASIRFLVQ